MELEDLKEKLKIVPPTSDEGNDPLPSEDASSGTAEHRNAQQKETEQPNEPDFEFEEDDLVGRTIGGHYEILSRIGSGGMSTVYKARHVLLDKFVAIKFILPKLIYDKQTAKRFQQEAKAAAALQRETNEILEAFCERRCHVWASLSRKRIRLNRE